MLFRCPLFRTGVILTLLLALAALLLDYYLATFFHVGSLSLALLLGIAVKIFFSLPPEQEAGFHFSSKHFLRIGIVLLGVRFNFILLLQGGWTVFILTSSIVIGGLLFITLLGYYCKLPRILALLIAIDSSICGASAVAALAPTIGAKKEEVALVIPCCSFIGMIGMAILALGNHLFSLTPSTFGLIAGATLHEVAQVMAALSLVPTSMEIGTLTKLMRVLFLAPVMITLSWFFLDQSQGDKKRNSKVICLSLLKATWFVLGFLLIGFLHTFLLHSYPSPLLSIIDQKVTTLSLFLMTMAMAGMGLQVNVKHFYHHGLRAFMVAFLGWLFLVSLAVIEIYFMKGRVSF